jgi:hypothetical protein
MRGLFDPGDRLAIRLVATYVSWAFEVEFYQLRIPVMADRHSI